MIKLLCLFKANENVLHQRLLLDILRVYPQRAGTYVQSMPYAFEPRASARWFANVALLGRLFAQEAVAPLVLSTADAVIFVCDHIFPSSLTSAALSRGVQHVNMGVRFACLNLMNLLFQRFISLKALILERVSVHERAACEAALLDALRKRVPEVQLIFALRSKLFLSSVNATDDGAFMLLDAASAKQASAFDVRASLVTGGGSAEVEAEHFEFDSMTSVPAVVTATLLHERLLSLLTAYQSVLPDALVESRIDIWKVLEPEVYSWAVDSQLAVLSLLRHAWMHSPLPSSRVFALRSSTGAGFSAWSVAVDLFVLHRDRAKTTSSMISLSESCWSERFSTSSIFGHVYALLYARDAKGSALKFHHMCNRFFCGFVDY